MLFPGFEDRLRVPARFVMMTILAVAVAAGTVAVWAVFHFVKPLESFAILLALVVVTAVVAIAHVDVATVDLPAVPASAAVLNCPGRRGRWKCAVYRSLPTAIQS
jgi:hypothetical protein